MKKIHYVSGKNVRTFCGRLRCWPDGLTYYESIWTTKRWANVDCKHCLAYLKKHRH